MPMLLAGILLFFAAAPAAGQSFTSGDGMMEFISCGTPITLLPADSQGIGIAPRLNSYAWGEPMIFRIDGAPGELFNVSFTVEDILWCHQRTALSMAADALYWVERDTLLDPNVPNAVTCDASGKASFRLGMTVEFPHGLSQIGSIDGGFAEVHADGMAVNALTGDTLRTRGSVEVSQLWCDTYERVLEFKDLVRGHTYTLSADTGTGRVTPILSGGETGGVGRIYAVVDTGAHARIDWTLPTRLVSDSGASLSCSFPSDAGLFRETQAQFDPNGVVTFVTGPDCALTIDMGITVTIPADAAPGLYFGWLLGSMVYEGNLKGTPDREPRSGYMEIVVTVADGDLPDRPELLQNYPNPFNGSTTIRYTIVRPEHVIVEIYDLLGRKVSTLADGPQIAGAHDVAWAAESVASGVYLYRLRTPSTTQIRKLLLMR